MSGYIRNIWEVVPEDWDEAAVTVRSNGDGTAFTEFSKDLVEGHDPMTVEDFETLGKAFTMIAEGIRFEMEDCS